MRYQNEKRGLNYECIVHVYVSERNNDYFVSCGDSQRRPGSRRETGALIKPGDVFLEQEQGWSVVTRNRSEV